MKFKKIVILLLLITLTFGVYGCGAIDKMKDIVSKDTNEDVDIVDSQEGYETSIDENMRNTVLYYKNENGYLVPVMRQIPWEEGIAKAALRNITDSPAIREEIDVIGLNPILPAGTKIKGMAIDPDTGLCRVNFTEEVLNYTNKEDEQGLVKGVVYTLTEFPTINEVQFLVGDKIINELKFGTKVGTPLKRENINLTENVNSDQSKIVVYYKSTTNGEYEYYVPVTVPTSAPEPNVMSALNKLFEGPPELSGLYTDIPASIALQGVEIKEGIAYINLSNTAMDILKDQSVVDSMNKNIALTLDQFEEIENVQLLINGSTLEEAGLKATSPETMPVFANTY
ncbi:MAG: spore gernimation protein GerM [Firmicutes bacterium]|nr:spore gernimation protein GerM [Bacillota bacterium]